VYRFITLLYFGFWVVEARGAQLGNECETTYSAPKLANALNSAESSFAELDVSGFSNSIEETILFVLPCLEETVEPPLVAQTHRKLALRAYSSRREELIQPSLLAGRQVAPNYEWPTALIPDGHEFRERYDLLASEPGETSSLRPPKTGKLWIDGVVSRDIPSARASILQYVDGDGMVQWTQYRMPADPVRSYPVVPKTRNGLLAAGGAQLVVGGVLYGASAAAQSAFHADDPERSIEDLDRLRANANNLRTASLGVGALGGVTAGLALAFWTK